VDKARLHLIGPEKAPRFSHTKIKVGWAGLSGENKKEKVSFKTGHMTSMVVSLNGFLFFFYIYFG